jgi:NO-binding membrane sensor protein with MHYT domain
MYYVNNGQFMTAKATITQSMRERYWFAVLGRCTGAKLRKTGIDFETHFVNFNRSPWNMEYGANQVHWHFFGLLNIFKLLIILLHTSPNQAGLQTLYLCFFLLFLPFACVHFSGVAQLSKKLEYVPLAASHSTVTAVQTACTSLQVHPPNGEALRRRGMSLAHGASPSTTQS